MNCDYFDGIPVSREFVELNFVEKGTGENLIKEVNPKLSKTDVNIAAAGNPDIRLEYILNKSANTLEDYNSVRLSHLINSTDAKNEEICKRIFVDLKGERDTLDYCYKIRDIDCGYLGVEYINVTYNGKNISPVNVEKDTFIIPK